MHILTGLVLAVIAEAVLGFGLLIRIAAKVGALG